MSGSPAERSGLEVGDRVKFLETINISSPEIQHSHIVGIMKDLGDTCDLVIGGKDTKDKVNPYTMGIIKALFKLQFYIH